MSEENTVDIAATDAGTDAPSDTGTDVAAGAEDTGGWEDLSALLNDAEAMQQPAAEPQQHDATSEQAQPAEQLPQPEQPATMQQQPQAVAQQAQEAAQAQQTQAEQPVSQTPDEAVAQVEQMLAENFNESVAALQQQYEQQLSQMVAPEEVQAMEEALAAGDAAGAMAVMQTVLARGLSMAHLNGLRASLHYIRELAPRYAQTTLAINTAAQTAEQKFREQFPNVDINTYGQEIVALAQAFRAQNPNMSMDELIQAVGQIIVARHGLQQAAQQQPQAQQARPADRVFIPADGAATSAQNPPPSADDEFNKALIEALANG